MPVFALLITVYENGKEVSLGGYSGKEVEALIEAIEDLWSPTYHSERHFEVVVEGDDDLLLVYRDGAYECPFPEDWLSKVIRFGLKTDLKLVGDRIPIQPRQLGLSPWPADVKVAFRPE